MLEDDEAEEGVGDGGFDMAAAIRNGQRGTEGTATARFPGGPRLREEDRGQGSGQRTARASFETGRGPGADEEGEAEDGRAEDSRNLDEAPITPQLGCTKAAETRPVMAKAGDRTENTVQNFNDVRRK